MITQLLWTIWTQMSSVPQKADELNLSLPIITYCIDQQISENIKKFGNILVAQCLCVGWCSLYENSSVNAGHFGEKSQHYNGINYGPTLAIAFLCWPKLPCFREGWWFGCAAVLPPFLTFWGLNPIFLGNFFSSTNTKMIFWGIKTTNRYRFDVFDPILLFSLDLLGSNFQRPAAPPHTPISFQTEYPHPTPRKIGLPRFVSWKTTDKTLNGLCAT